MMNLKFASVLLAAALPAGLWADALPSTGGASSSGSAGTYDSLGADPPAVSFTGVTTNFTNGSWSIGFEFSTTTAIDVTALGFYDATLTGGSVGLGNCSGCGEVGIYNSSGTLLVSAQVTTAGTLVGDFYYVPIASTLLAAGQDYYAVGVTGNADYTYNTTGFGVASNINYVADAFVSSSTLAFPTASDGVTAGEGGAWFGANFEESSASAVPDPSSLLLLVTILGGFAFWTARKRRTV
jgi:hypothetical protein